MGEDSAGKGDGVVMQIERVQAENFKIFEKLDLPLNGKNTVLFGVNGTGKSTVLSIINYAFRIWVKRFNPSQGRAYESMNDENVRAGAAECHLEADVSLGDNLYTLSRTYMKKFLPTGKAENSYSKEEYDSFYSNLLVDNKTKGGYDFPIFVNYGTNRSVMNVPLRIRNDHEFDQASALEHAIDNASDFQSFFEWFRNQEDIENETIRETGDYTYKDPQLTCVRTAVEAMLENMTDLRVKRNPLCMTVKKGNEEIRVDQLSDGEKCTLALLGDLARRLAIANRGLENPLEGEGVVLIDEIELHMHPSWQRRILRVLGKVFPNIQFIVTTHSPQVLGEADDSYNIFLLDTENGKQEIIRISRLDGYDSNFILEKYMETASKSERTRKLISDINEAIAQKDYLHAETLLEQLKKIAGESDADVIMAEGFLRKSRWLDEKNYKKS